MCILSFLVGAPLPASVFYVYVRGPWYFFIRLLHFTSSKCNRNNARSMPHCCGANRWRIVSLQSRYFITIHQPKSFLSPQLWTRTKACLLLLDETYSSQAPCSPLFALSCTYTWDFIHTTSIFKTSTEVLSIVLHTSSRNTQSCLVCCLKGKTLLLPYL